MHFFTSWKLQYFLYFSELLYFVIHLELCSEFTVLICNKYFIKTILGILQRNIYNCHLTWCNFSLSLQKISVLKVTNLSIWISFCYIYISPRVVTVLIFPQSTLSYRTSLRFSVTMKRKFLFTALKGIIMKRNEL